MEQVSQQTLPSGYGYEWTGTAYREVAASGQTGAILGLAVLFAFLFLVGLYESWMIPVPVLLSVPIGILGAFLGILIGRLAVLAWGTLGRRCIDQLRFVLESLHLRTPLLLYGAASRRGAKTRPAW
jgi:multidrug efflux pump subunit AcrB